MILFETHCHLNDQCYYNDFYNIADKCYINNILYILSIGTDEKSSFKTQFLSQKNKNIYASVGFHPHNSNKFNKDSLRILKNLSKHPKVLAIGEIGLDFNRGISTLNKQEEALVKQIRLSREVNLPIIFHDRNSEGRLAEIIEYKKINKKKAVLHCFSGKEKDLQKYLNLGLKIGLTGIISMYKRGLSLRTIIKKIPLDRILMETDSPYLMQNKNKINGSKNDPSFINSLLLTLEKYKNKNIKQVSNKILKNTYSFFKLKTK